MTSLQSRSLQKQLADDVTELSEHDINAHSRIAALTEARS